MKKHIIYTFLGGAILFFWQFLSHKELNIHADAQTYTPKQLEILASLEALDIEPGQYMLGQPDPSLPKEEQEASMKAQAGKPWGVLNYQTVDNSNMMMNLIRGFSIALIVAALFFWLVRNMAAVDLKKGLLLGLAVGMISYFLEPYSDYIWYKTPGILAHLLDGIVPWGIMGAIGGQMAKKA